MGEDEITNREEDHRKKEHQIASGDKLPIKECKTISIFGTRGGVGKTTLAANLAASIKRESNARCLLIDLDLPLCGDIPLLLKASGGKTLVDLLKLIDKLDSRLLKGYLTSHSSGIELLAGVSNPKEVTAIDPPRIEQLLQILKDAYDYIVIDAGSEFSPVTITVLDASEVVLLVLTPDIFSIKQCTKSLEVFRGLHFSSESMKLILNRSDIKGGIRPADVEVRLKKSIFASLKEDEKTVFSSINKASLYVTEDTRSIAAGDIVSLTGKLMGKRQSDGSMKGGILDAIKTKEVSGIKTEELESFTPAGKGGVVASDRKGLEEKVPELSVSPAKVAATKEEKEKLTALKETVHKRLIDEMNLKHLGLGASGAEISKELRDKVQKKIQALLDEEGKWITDREMRRNLVSQLMDEALGLGPIEDFLRDPRITEIMVNGKDHIYVEEGGKLRLTGKTFTTNTQVLSVIERIVAPLGRRIDESVPMVDARLKDGSRVNAIIPPLSLMGPSITIRKFFKEKLTADNLVGFGTMTKEAAKLLEACVKARQNIVISGGTGSGKTTLLNVLSSFIPSDERIVTVEDSAELQLPQEHVVKLESRPPNIEGKGAIMIRDLVRNCLRMRPDRIVIGECRGGEALDMLQAMNTGHDGSLTTAHSNSPRDTLARLETMVMMAGMDLPVRAIREQISSAINLIVHESRLSDGSRKVVNITEVTGMEKDIITLQDIFIFKQTGIDEKGKVKGEFKATGFVPKFAEDFRSKGIELDREIFK